MYSEFVVSIDVGTTKISMLIGEMGETGSVRIIGVGTVPSEGVKKGLVCNIEQVTDRIRVARAEAEKMAGVVVHGVCTGVSGSHIRSFNSRGVIAIPTSRREVAGRDIERVIEAAGGITLPVDREILHTIPQDFVVDGQADIRDPIGMSGMRLEAEVHIVTGQSMPTENFMKVFKKAGLQVIDLVFEPLATARAVLTDEERESGCLLIDMGGGVTSYVLYYGGCPRCSGVVAAGGTNVTNDLAIGLRVPYSVAEDVKRRNGVALASLAGEQDTIEVPPFGGRAQVEIRSQIVAAIIEPRCEEMFTMVKRSVAANPYFNVLGGGVVITGGGAMIRGMEGVAEQVFDLPVRSGRPSGLEGLAEIVEDESCCTGVGLLLYERDGLMGNAPGRRRTGRPLRWMFEGMKRIASLF